MLIQLGSLKEVNVLDIATNITQLIGKTPMLELRKLERLLKLTTPVIVKLEYFNPGGSIKDRAAFNMLDVAEKQGLINRDTVIIEATSGNTGIALAMIGAAKGYRVIITMPETMSRERQMLLTAYGAKVILTPGEEGMEGAIREAEKIASETANSFIPYQFDNFSNPAIHRITTANEIWEDTMGKVDIIVAGVGTGGTITGVAGELKSRKSSVKAIAVEPKTSAVISGEAPGKHGLQGIGAGFIPKILDLELIDEIVKVDEENAFDTCRKLAAVEGVLVGISSGAVVYAAIELARRVENKDKTIVAILADSGERYLSENVFEC